MEQPNKDENAKKSEGTEEKPDRIGEIAQEALAEIESKKESKKAEEQKPEETGKDTSSDKKSEPKTHEKEEEEKPQEGKEHKLKKSANERIKELTGEIYRERQNRDEDKQKIEVLEKELLSIRKSLEEGGAIETDKSRAKEAVQNNWKQYEKDDSDKPFAERREMSDEAWEEFQLENPRAANEWLIDRRDRRKQELQEALEKAEPKKEEKTEQLSEKEFIETQNRAKANLIKAYPQLDIGEKVLEIAKEILSEEDAVIFQKPEDQLSEEERTKKQELYTKHRDEVLLRVRKENKVYDEMMKVIESDEEKYLQSANGPELVMKELNKRLSDTGRYTEADIERAKQEAIEAERKRLASIDNSNPPSTGSEGSVKVKSSVQNDPQYKEGLDLYLRATRQKGMNKTEEDYIKILERRKGIRGANKIDPEDAKKAGISG